MIKEYDLRVIFARNFDPLGSVAGWVDIWVHVDHLSVSLISEQHALVIVRVDPEVRRVVDRWVLRIPVEEAKIRRSWQQLFFAFKDVSKVLGFESVRQIDVARYLVVAFLLLANENNGGHATATNIGLPIGQCRQEFRVVDFKASVA